MKLNLECDFLFKKWIFTNTHRIHVCYIWIYGNIYHQYIPNVSIYIYIYIPYMDPMGYEMYGQKYAMSTPD